MSLEFFRLSPEQVEKIRAHQQGLCPVCGNPVPKGNIDHNHTTGEVRGIPCWKCNKAMGLLMDNPERLRRAAQYIEDPPARHALGGPHYGNTGRVRSLASIKKLSRGRSKKAAAKPRACPVTTRDLIGE